MLKFTKLLFVTALFVVLSNCGGKKNNFYVHNKDPETIDSLHIFVGNKTYLIEDLKPKKTKGIKIYKMGGKKISLQADNEKPMSLSSIAHPPFKGTHRLIVTKKRIISKSSLPN